MRRLLFFALILSILVIPVSLASDDEKRTMCGGVFEKQVLPTARPTPPPGSNPADFFPFAIRYYFDPPATASATAPEGWRQLLETDVIEVAHVFSEIVKGPKLNEVRLPRSQETDAPVPDGEGGYIIRPICGIAVVSPEYVQPRYLPNGIFPEPGVTVNATGRVAKDQGKISLVVFLQIREGDNDKTTRCGDRTNAYADVCARDPITQRPTHGRLVFCKFLEEEEERFNTLMHETLHIMIPNLLGYDYPGYYPLRPGIADRKLAAENITWIRITRPNWKFKNGTRTTLVSEAVITPNVLSVVKEHFNCPDLVGAEVGHREWSSAGIQIDDGHWNQRLFPDEILAPRETPGRRLTKLTMAALKDSGWYDVNWEKAQPFSFSRPLEFGCDVAQLPCYDVLNKARTLDAGVQQMHFLGPYCDPTGQVLTPRCSADGRIRLVCFNLKDFTADCETLTATKDYHKDYHSVCDLGVTQSAASREAGFRVGFHTMCLTFTKLKKKAVPFGGCIKYTCESYKIKFEARPIISWYSGSSAGYVKTECSLLQECAAGEGSKKTWTRPTAPACGAYDAEFLCPDFNLVCNSTKKYPYVFGPKTGSSSTLLLSYLQLISVTFYVYKYYSRSI